MYLYRTGVFLDVFCVHSLLFVVHCETCLRRRQIAGLARRRGGPMVRRSPGIRNSQFGIRNSLGTGHWPLRIGRASLWFERRSVRRAIVEDHARAGIIVVTHGEYVRRRGTPNAQEHERIGSSVQEFRGQGISGTQYLTRCVSRFWEYRGHNTQLVASLRFGPRLRGRRGRFRNFSSRSRKGEFRGHNRMALR